VGLLVEGVARRGLLKELPGGGTRLVISGYQAIRPQWLERIAFSWLYVPVVWPMQARMLAVMKRTVEQAARGTDVNVSNEGRQPARSESGPSHAA
jgi:hypothetical protein